MSEIQDTNVPHEAKVDDAVDAQMRRTSSQGTIADLAAPGSTYAEAEAVAARDKINLILKVLRDAELIPT